MNNVYIELLDNLDRGLIAIDQSDHSRIERCSEKITLCQKLSARLRKLYLVHTFKNKEDEIHFFKTLKPRLFSELYFQIQVFEYYKMRPKGSLKAKKIHLNQRLDKSSVLISDYCEFQNYHLLKSTHLDDLYYIKQEFNPKLHSGLKYPIDLEFSSPAEPTLSCLIAADKMVQFFKNELYSLKNPKLDPSWEFMKSLNWKGSKTDLVELMYALHAADILSGELKDGFKMAEKAFNMDVGNFYRTYTDIKLKKNPTNLLDNLKKALLNKINKEMTEN